jgi:integrase
MTSLATKSARLRLPVRREPHWTKLGAGAYLGFRRGSDTWVARFRDRGGHQHYHAIGEHEEFTDAKATAEAWFAQLAGGARRAPSRGTLKAALEAYLADLRRHGRDATATEAEARFKLVVYDDPLAQVRLEDATRDEFEAWRDRLRPGREPRSVNRHVRAIIAALNRAVRKLGHVGNPAAWELEALADDGDGEAAAVFLTAEQRARLIGKAGKALAAFMRGLEYTGARPSEMAAATVADFDSAAETLVLRHRKGRPPKLRPRSVTLSADGAAFFRNQVRGKLPAAPIVPNEAGGHWQRHEWSREIRAAITAANAKAKPKARLPKGASAYSFRHSRISELLQVVGVDPLTVAKQTGTSLAMMEKYYFRFVPSALKEKLDAAESAS